MTKQTTIAQLDLFEFLQILAKGWKKIVLFTALFMAVAFSGSYLVTAKWQTEMAFSEPTVDQLADYYQYASLYHLVENNDKTRDTETSLPFEQQLTAQVYNKFLTNLTADNVIFAFLQQSDYVAQKIAKQQLKPAEQQALLQQLKEQFRFKSANTRSNLPDRLSLTIDEKERVALLLSQYVQYVNTITAQQLSQQLATQWQTLSQQLTQIVNLQKNDTQHQTTQQSVEMNQSLSWQTKWQLMQTLPPIEQTLNLQTYYSLKTAMPPLSAYTPDRLLWISMAGFFGFFIGGASVIISHLRRKRDLE